MKIDEFFGNGEHGLIKEQISDKLRLFQGRLFYFITYHSVEQSFASHINIYSHEAYCGGILHILSFNAFFLATFLITTFLIPVEKIEFSVVRSEVKIFAIFRSDYG